MQHIKRTLPELLGKKRSGYGCRNISIEYRLNEAWPGTSEITQIETAELPATQHLIPGPTLKLHNPGKTKSLQS